MNHQTITALIEEGNADLITHITLAKALTTYIELEKTLGNNYTTYDNSPNPLLDVLIKQQDNIIKLLQMMPTKPNKKPNKVIRTIADPYKYD